MNILFCLIPKEKVVYVFDDFTVRQVLEKMQAHHYSSIPILSRDGSYVGTLSEGDLLWYIKDNNLTIVELENRNIMDVERFRNNQAVGINLNLEDIIDIASNQNFVPVLDDLGAFIGIVTRRDIINYMKEKKTK